MSYSILPSSSAHNPLAFRVDIGGISSDLNVLSMPVRAAWLADLAKADTSDTTRLVHQLVDNLFRNSLEKAWLDSHDLVEDRDWDLTTNGEDSLGNAVEGSWENGFSTGKIWLTFKDPKHAMMFKLACC